MHKFRKKPIEIEAVQMTANPSDLPPWFQTAMTKDRDAVGAIWGTDRDGGVIFVNTLEGPLRIGPDDWIIQGVKGELYPVKNDIFLETYEAVDAA
jgi:hypothetical protein